MSDDNVIDINQAAGKIKSGRPNPAFREDWQTVLRDASAQREAAYAAKTQLLHLVRTAEVRRQIKDLDAAWEHNHQLGMRCRLDYRFRTFEEALASVAAETSVGNAYDPVFIADAYEFSDVRQLIFTASALHRERIKLDTQEAVVPHSFAIENDWFEWLDDLAALSRVKRSVMVRRILGAFLASPLAADLGGDDLAAKPNVSRRLAVQVSEETNLALADCAAANEVSVAAIMCAALLAERRGRLSQYHKAPPILVTPTERYAPNAAAD